ncbi:MAG: hypothetical protein HZB70_03135 [Candidatus Berkelbacteria bacterium]|nr:MAG: hypothetical protein HZB70_03135 [Candidatus Berkelbacteria bacterium]QQG51705.1 MAG: hypothetical protein HY845_04055 [Candidatus Berkelbacteria bacterium]
MKSLLIALMILIGVISFFTFMYLKASPEINTPSKASLSTYSGSGFEFSYNSEWVHKSFLELHGASVAPPVDIAQSLPEVFLTKAQLEEFDPNSTDSIRDFSEVSVVLGSGDVETGTKEASGLKCSDHGLPVTTDSPDLSRVKHITVSDMPALGVESLPCQQQFYTVIIQIGSGFLSLDFEKTSSIESLSPDQKIIVNTFKRT